MFESRVKVRITADGGKGNLTWYKFTVVVEEGYLSCPPSFEQVATGRGAQVFTRDMGKATQSDVQKIVRDWLREAGAYGVDGYQLVRDTTVTFTPKMAKVTRPATSSVPSHAKVAKDKVP